MDSTTTLNRLFSVAPYAGAIDTIRDCVEQLVVWGESLPASADHSLAKTVGADGIVNMRQMIQRLKGWKGWTSGAEIMPPLGMVHIGKIPAFLASPFWGSSFLYLPTADWLSPHT